MNLRINTIKLFSLTQHPSSIMKDERSPAKAMHIAMTSSPAWLLPKWVETDKEIILLAIAISMGNFPRVKFVGGVADRNCSQRSFAFVPSLLIIPLWYSLPKKPFHRQHKVGSRFSRRWLVEELQTMLLLGEEM